MWTNSRLAKKLLAFEGHCSLEQAVCCHYQYTQTQPVPQRTGVLYTQDVTRVHGTPVNLISYRGCLQVSTAHPAPTVLNRISPKSSNTCQKHEQEFIYNPK